MIPTRVVAVGCALLLGLSACGSDEPLYIAIAGPLSAANGVSMERAARMAADEINRGDGMGGRRVELVMVDDSASPDRAIRMASQLRARGEIVAVIGHINSSVSLRAATIYNATSGEGAPLLQISPASSAPALTQAGEWTFRITPTDLEFAPALARQAQRMGRTRAAVLYVNDDYGQGVASSFDEAFRQVGGAVVSEDPYLPVTVARGDELDPYLTRALARNVDALVIGGQAEAGLKIIAAARRLGYSGPILGADGLTAIKDGGPIAEGVFISSSFLPDRPGEQAQTFVQRYRERFQSLPDHRGAMTYDIMYLLQRAVEEGGDSRQALRDYVAGIGTRTPAFQGVSGRIAFDENGDVQGKEVMVGVVRGGQLVTSTAGNRE